MLYRVRNVDIPRVAYVTNIIIPYIFRISLRK